MKKRSCIILAICMILLTSACGKAQKTFNGSRTGNDNQFLMEYSVLNTTDSQELVLEAGDSIAVDIVANSGRTDIIIQKEGADPIYRGDDVSTCSFSIGITEAGTYTITVTGSDDAAGSVSFVKVTAEKHINFSHDGSVNAYANTISDHAKEMAANFADVNGDLPF